MGSVGDSTPESGAGQKAAGSQESRSPGAVASTVAKSGKQIGGQKEPGISLLNSVNKSTSQIRKHPHRRSGSPLDWFPRRKADSFLKRKIKLLQEVGGMNLSLDETLGGANPHYSRIAREKIAARQAARKAISARKAAMVEASWCRILKAARIQNKEADAELLKAEKCVFEAFEAAAAMGVMMYDRPDCPRRPGEIETSFGNAGGSTHTVNASFETAFEVDKEVAAAVKEAFIRLANCPSSSNREEFRDLLRKISENPDNEEIHQELSDKSSEGETEFGGDIGSCCAADVAKQASTELRERKYKNEQPHARIKTFTELVDMMFDRLKCLQEDEISSLAIIVATSGLNATLVEMESSKEHDTESCSSMNSDPVAILSRNSSSAGVGSRRYSIQSLMEGPMKRKGAVTEVLGLEKYLVKHLSRLEREVLEARNSKKDCSNIEIDKSSKSVTQRCGLAQSDATSEYIPGLGNILVKRASWLERDIQASKTSETCNPTLTFDETVDSSLFESGNIKVAQDGKDVEKATEKFSDVQHKQLMDLQAIEGNSETKGSNSGSSFSDGKQMDKENIDLSKISIQKVGGSPNKSDLLRSNRVVPRRHMSRIERAKLEVLEAFSVQGENGNNEMHQHIGLDKIFVKPVHRLEREKMKALEHSKDIAAKGSSRRKGIEVTPFESLDKVLVKHVSKLEKEKLAALQAAEDEAISARKMDQNLKKNGAGLEEELVKHQSKHEKAKLTASHPTDDTMKHAGDRWKVKEKELNEAWGGLSLENSIRPHVSRLERDKAAWKKAEEEQRMQMRGL